MIGLHHPQQGTVKSGGAGERMTGALAEKLGQAFAPSVVPPSEGVAAEGTPFALTPAFESSDIPCGV